VKGVEAGSLTAAARPFGLSHAPASKHVRALEQALGDRLLDLTTRRLNLKEAGRRCRDRCMEILAEPEDAALEASRYRSTPHGLARVTAPSQSLPSSKPYPCSLFSRQYRVQRNRGQLNAKARALRTDHLSHARDRRVPIPRQPLGQPFKAIDSAFALARMRRVQSRLNHIHVTRSPLPAS
jgi:DNA-binding transcriptional LysR family regulator